MWRQVAGFAVFGGALSLFGAAFAQGRSAGGGGGYILSWNDEHMASGFGVAAVETALVVATAVGVLVGFLAGLVLWSAGIRMSGPPGGRLGRVVCAGLSGVMVGMSPTLALLVFAFSGSSASVGLPYLVYVLSAVLAYVLAIMSVRGVLRLSGDSLTRETVRATAVVLPASALVATGAGVATAWALGFTTGVTTWVATIIAVAVVLVGAFAVARAWVLWRGSAGSAAR